MKMRFKRMRYALLVLIMACSTFACLFAGGDPKPMQVAICPRLVPEPGGDRQAFIKRVDDLFVNKTEQWRYVANHTSHFKFYSTPLTWMAGGWYVNAPIVLDPKYSNLSRGEMRAGRIPRAAKNRSISNRPHPSGSESSKRPNNALFVGLF